MQPQGSKLHHRELARGAGPGMREVRRVAGWCAEPADGGGAVPHRGRRRPHHRAQHHQRQACQDQTHGLRLRILW
nr:MAG TPA: hypothetical protein [Caudoviricetes sp.]